MPLRNKVDAFPRQLFFIANNMKRKNSQLQTVAESKKSKQELVTDWFKACPPSIGRDERFSMHVTITLQACEWHGVVLAASYLGCGVDDVLSACIDQTNICSAESCEDDITEKIKELHRQSRKGVAA